MVDDDEDEEKEFDELLSSNLKELELSKESEDDQSSKDIDTLLPSNVIKNYKSNNIS